MTSITSDENLNKCINDKYRIKQRISKGSIGKVYVAEDLNSKQDVIIKLIPKNIKRIANRIKRDTEIPRLVVHDNIVKIHDFGEDQDFAYIIYPYHENDICMANLKKTDFDFKIQDNLVSMVNILCQICDAIEFMHSKFVTHRDIKPNNIIINNNFAFIIDFDLSCVINNSEYLPQQGWFGTPNYLAPEIWRKDDIIDLPLTDIYSFGVTIYFIFNKKKVPFPEKSVADLEYVVRHNNPIPSNSGIRSLDKFIMKIIDKNPLKRPNIIQIKSFLQKLIV